MTPPPHCWRDDCEYCAERRRRAALREKSEAIWRDGVIGGGSLQWRPGSGWDVAMPPGEVIVITVEGDKCR